MNIREPCRISFAPVSFAVCVLLGDTVGECTRIWLVTYPNGCMCNGNEMTFMESVDHRRSCVPSPSSGHIILVSINLNDDACRQDHIIYTLIYEIASITGVFRIYASYLTVRISYLLMIIRKNSISKQPINSHEVRIFRHVFRMRAYIIYNLSLFNCIIKFKFIALFLFSSCAMFFSLTFTYEHHHLNVAK